MRSSRSSKDMGHSYTFRALPTEPGDDQTGLHETWSSAIEEEKCEGPSTCIFFLGMELNSVTKAIRLPEKKLEIEVLTGRFRGMEGNEQKRITVY